MKGILFLIGFLLFIWLVCSFFADRRMMERSLPEKKLRVGG